MPAVIEDSTHYRTSEVRRMIGARGNILFPSLRDGVFRSARCGDWRGSTFLTAGPSDVAKTKSRCVIAARQGL
jgi:hypothetical protein